MNMVGMSFMELLVIVLLGGSPLSLPLSLPPLPEDPVLAQVAPEECLWYLSWSGIAEPDPQSKNHTEKLLAEPEVQRFTRELEARLREALKRGVPQGPEAAQGAILAEEAPNLLKVLLTRPTAVFLESVAVNPAGALVKGGAVVSVGDRSDEVKKLIDRIAQALLGDQARPNDQESGELKLPMPPGAPPVEIRWHKNYAIIGIGEGAIDDIVKRFDGKAPEWLAKVRKELPVERPAVVHFLNVQKALATALPFAGVEGFKVVNALGLDRTKYYANVSGLEGTGTVSRSQLGLDGKPKGLFALFEGKPLEQDELATIPKDATIAIATKIDANKVRKVLTDIFTQLDPRGQGLFENQLRATEEQLGFKLSEDVFQSLGDTWCVYNSPSEGGLVFTGLTAVVPVKDRERLLKAHDKLVTSLRAVNEELARLNADDGRGRRPHAMVVSDFQFGGQNVYYLNFIGAEAPFAPAWCITDKELIMSLFPQMIKARLARGADAGSLAELPEIAQCFKGDQRPCAVFYQDTRTMFRLVYPIFHMFAAMICSELQQQRVDIDISLLPSMAAIEPHLLPGVNAVYMSEAAIRWESRQTLAMPSAALPMLGAATFFGLARSSVDRDFQAHVDQPFDLQAITPEGAQRTVSINNLKQIGLAMHNYLDTHKHFPVADGADTKGKPTLSWRVHILPFIEQQALFDEFKLDEPWDSEHNKKLIEKMPKLYRTPGSAVHEKHKTNYVTIRGKDTMFPAGKKIGPRDVTDGFSNTVLVLEVSDDRAVVWTRPDDFEPDADEPLKGVVGLRNGKFLVVFGDGAVRTLSESINKDTVRAIYTRNGGEPVSLGD